MPAVGSVRRPSPGDSTTGETRRKRVLPVITIRRRAHPQFAEAASARLRFLVTIGLLRVRSGSIRKLYTGRRKSDRVTEIAQALESGKATGQGHTMSAQSATVFGGTGFLGRRILRHLHEAGFTVRIASRHPERGFSMFPAADS